MKKSDLLLILCTNIISFLLLTVVAFGADALSVDGNGNVGIGTSSPSSGLKLDVEGKVGATQYCDQNGANCKSITSMGTFSTQNVVTGSRTFWTVYQNTTGKPMFITIVCNASYNGEWFGAYVGNTNPPTPAVVAMSVYSNSSPMSFIVLPNYYYYLYRGYYGAIQTWTEWY